MSRQIEASSLVPDDPVEETAARWFARGREGLSRCEQEQLQAWLAENPRHSSAYARIARGWELSGAASSHPAVCAMRSEALMLRPERRWRPRAIAASVAGLLAVGAAGLYWTGGDLPGARSGITTAALAPQVLQTAIGERSTATLADGSIVTLNTDSQVRVLFSEGERNVVLLAGQALFQVAKDEDRPFIVTAGNRRIVAVGTQFEVKLDKGGVRVALLEGKVKVEPVKDEPAARTVLLDAPNEILEAREQRALGAAPISVRTADVAELTSWREGRVRFNDTPLSEAVAEMNRYSRTRIVADGDVGSIRISGAFRTGQSASFVNAVTDLLPVSARREADTIRLSKDS